MILLDNEIYVTNACNLLQKIPGCRVIPFSISCLTGGDFFTTSIINLISILVLLYLLFKTFGFQEKQVLILTGIFGFNSIVAFPYFYAAAHSYVYTIMAMIVGLLLIERVDKINPKNMILFILSALFLKLVRSEGPVYFVIGFIAYLIQKFMNSKSITDFWQTNKKHFKSFGFLILLIMIINYLFQLFLPPGEEITRNIIEGGYENQFPRDSYYAVAIFATFDYLRGFITPYYMNFYGNYFTWLSIHTSLMYRVLLYSSFGLISLLATYFIFTRKKHFINYLIIALAIFIIPTFLISSLLRNQWFYPSRSLLGCILSLPFFAHSIYLLPRKQFITPIIIFIGVFSTSTFAIHHFFHYQDERSMYQYETIFLGIENPTINKTYAQLLLKEKDFLKATQILREAGRQFPKEGIFLSANHFFLWAENLYWSAASSFFYKSPLTEEKVLKELYAQPNFFGALACLQDIRVPIENCKNPAFLKQLCNPIYKKKFGYTYYKKPRLKVEQVCSKNQ